MLVQMNSQQPPQQQQHYGGAGDFKPPIAGHFHHHQSQQHHSQQQHSQHQFDDFDAPPFQHASNASHHHHAFNASSNHPWASAGLTGLSHFGGYDHDPQDDEDQPEDEEEDDEEDVYGHHHSNEDAATPTASMTPVAKRKSSTASGGGSSAGKKEVFMCPEVHCGKTFPRSFALRRHMRIHTGNKPYACDFEGCTQRFNTSGNLSRHKRIHSGERPYPCVFATCGKRFNTSTKLKRHMRIHFPDGQSLFHCVQQACTFACDNYKEYVHHQRQHGNPAYAVPLKGGGAGPQDENVDHSNLPTPTSAKGSRAKAAKNKGAKAQPRVSKASKAAAEATTAALHGDFLAGLHPPSGDFGDRRGYDHSPSTSAASGLSMLMKEAHRESDFDEYDHRRGNNTGKQQQQNQSSHQYSLDLDRPARLPFPTGAFPSESTGIASASPMNLNLASTFGSTFTGRAASTSSNQATSYGYDHATTSSSSSASSAFPSYLRGPPSDGYSHSSHNHHASYLGFPPLRPEDADDGYDSASPRTSSQHHHQSSQHHHSQSSQQHHHHSQSNQQHGGDADDDKYGGYGSVPHAVGPEFTGEELSAVLELMKDS